MANNFNIDPNVWYQIASSLFDPSVNSLQVGFGHTAIYMYATNLTSSQQRWQIFPLSDGGGWNFRAQVTGSGAYISQCVPGVGVTADADSAPADIDVCMALGPATDSQRRWILSSNGDGTFDIQPNVTNALYQGYYLDDYANDTIAFTNDTSDDGIKWTFLSITNINDEGFSTGIAAASTTQSVPITSSSPVTTSTGTVSTSQTQTSLSSSPTSTTTAAAIPSSSSKHSGLSMGASAGIGVGVGISVVAVGCAFIFWIFRKRRRQSRASASGGCHAKGSVENKTAYEAAGYYHSPPAELHHHSVAELDQSPDRNHIAELGT